MHPWMLPGLAVGCLLTAAAAVVQKESVAAISPAELFGESSRSNGSHLTTEPTGTGHRLPSKTRGLRKDESYASRMQASSGGTAVVIGQVNRPGPVSLRASDTLASVIEKAGGMGDFAMPKKVRLTRGSKETIYDLRAAEARSVRIQDGDTVNVPERIF